jgi:hypothetical protein
VSWVPAERVLDAVAAQRQVIAEQRTRMANFSAYHAAERQKLAEEQRQAAHDLGQAILPRLDTASIAAAANAVGMVGLPSENIPAKLEARRAWLGERLREILHDPRFANRELLRHPRTGSLVTAMLEAEEHNRVTYPFVAACESHPRFERLWSTNFGTPEQTSSWWRYSHWQDRSAAQALTTQLSKETFAEVRDEYAKCKETIAVYDAEIARLRAEIAAGEKLDRDYAALWDEHQTIDARALEHTRNRILQHVLGSDTSTVQQHLRAKSSPLLILFLRASGVAAKLAYLDGIQKKNMDDLELELKTQKERLDRAEQKTRKRWAPMPLEGYQKLTEDRRPRYEKRWQRFGKVYNTVHVYDRWDRGRYYEQLLWWDLMTRGRYDGSYMAEVSTFHAAHPHYQYDADWKSLAASSTYEDQSSASDNASDDEHAAATSIDADSSSSDTDSPSDASDASDAGGDDLQTTDAS